MRAREHGNTRRQARRIVLPLSHAPPRPRVFSRPRGRAGFTLVEVILTILVVGVGLTASVRALPVLLQVSRASRHAVVAQRLATALLAEIEMLPYEEPNDPPRFGREPGESAVNRADFDDIDDYDAWTASPPQKKDGREEPDCSAYTRSVTVVSVNVYDFNSVKPDGSTDAKRITITVMRDGMAPVVLRSVRLENANREDLE